MANEPLKGKRFVEAGQFKKKQDWAKFMKKIADQLYPKAQKITLVMDNFCTRSRAAFYESFQAKEAKRLCDKFDFVYTPKYGSWLNMAEIELHALNGQCLNKRIETFKEVELEVDAWQNYRNNKNSQINWQFSVKDSRVKLKELYPSIDG